MGLTILITLSLLILLTVSQAGQLFAQAIKAQYSPDIIWQLLFYKSIPLVSLALPPAFFLSGLIVLTKLYSSREMTVLFATGFSMSRFIFYIQVLGVIVAASVFVFEGMVRPWAIRQSNQIYHVLSASTEFEFLREQEFITFAANGQTIYIEDISVDKKTLSNVFIAEEANNRILQAASGSIVVSENGRYFVLRDGQMIEGDVSSNDFTRSSFELFGFRLPDPVVRTYHRAGNMSFKELWQNWQNRHNQSELTWRFVYPMMVLVLAFWLVPFSKTSPRASGLIKVVPALLFFMAYSTFLNVIQRQITNGSWPYYYVGWWLHLLMLLFGILYFYSSAIVIRLRR